MLKSRLPYDQVRILISSVVVLNACFSNRPKKIPTSVGARKQHCLTPLRISIGSLRVSVERIDHTLQLGWATCLWENLK